MKRLTIRNLMLATGGRLRDLNTPDTEFDRVSIDSRDVRRGDIFWALRGEREDGHNFTAQALERQAHLCVVSADRAERLTGPMLIVDDPLSALGRFGNWYRRQMDAMVIGVTGSVGKTTTRELIFSALSDHFEGTRSPSNFNSQIGLPLSLLELDQEHEFAVLEMGASEIGNIRRLCELALPEVGVITAVGAAHLESFGSIEAIVETKGELLEQLPTTGFAVLPGDDSTVRQMADRAPCPVIFVGQGDDNHIQATDVAIHNRCLQFSCEGARFSLPLSGRHLISNALCAIAIGLEVGMSPCAIASGLAKFSPLAGRGRMTQVGTWTVIDETYNASPLAVSAACRLLADTSTPAMSQRLLVLGDMLELGPSAAHEHERIGQLAAQLCVDRLLTCGRHADDIARGAARAGMGSHQIVAAKDVETLLAVLDCWLQPHDTLLVKGSRATRMERIIEWLRDRAQQEEHQRQIKPQRYCA
ncbi:UDP-N-acetylmuramoyl-tripeptide--D-alanyl-D-alanine ligase [Schlesneria paludicola]|uniref:UDP-N-acetylmuramoyl-tripeptide--D-alanyl-D- alanine ligase n=1 Tax=Schlesneria paludicola TaxID=360056 RepID=UPI00029AB6E7|nr:UDP-N-acetylmuramoyl-tripeptide--D-alanyl-D-alanine ligase [Schlesneria paludicola]